MWTWTSRRLSMNFLIDVVFVFRASEIGLAYPLVSGNCVRVAGGKYSALRHYGNVISDFKHHTHVMFNNDDIDRARQLLNLGDRAFGLGRAHTAGRLVEQ